MERNFRKGDKVRWASSQGDVIGHIKKKIVNPIKIKRHKVKATKRDPSYLVVSDETGAEAAHRPQTLKKTS